MKLGKNIHQTMKGIIYRNYLLNQGYTHSMEMSILKTPWDRKNIICIQAMHLYRAGLADVSICNWDIQI